MLHESHATVLWPAFLIVVADNVFVIGIWVLSQVPLDQLSGFLLRELEDHEDLIDVAAVESQWVPGFLLNVGEGHEFMRVMVWSS